MKTEIKNTRLLAAVMFIDIVGYTALMQKDENRAIYLRSQKRSIVEAEVSKHRGTVIQYYGDGALIIFRSSYLAVKSAIQIQSQLLKKEVPARIGIHSGEIVRDAEGVYGNAVNIASRIESLSLPGGILISEHVFEEIKNHQEIATRPAGKFHLKNIEQPLRIYAINFRQSAAFPRVVRQKWEGMVSTNINTELIRPYISNINAGLLN